MKKIILNLLVFISLFLKATEDPLLYLPDHSSIKQFFTNMNSHVEDNLTMKKMMAWQQAREFHWQELKKILLAAPYAEKEDDIKKLKPILTYHINILLLSFDTSQPLHKELINQEVKIFMDVCEKLMQKPLKIKFAAFFENNRSNKPSKHSREVFEALDEEE